MNYQTILTKKYIHLWRFLTKQDTYELLLHVQDIPFLSFDFLPPQNVFSSDIFFRRKISLENRREQKLIHRSIEGDRDAFGALVEKYKSAVFSTAYEFTRNVADAEDISQETFIKAYLKLSTLRDKTRFAAWLRRITRSLCIDWQRKQMRKREVSFGELVRANGQENFANLPKTPEEELEKKELAETVLAALDNLSETFLYQLSKGDYIKQGNN